MARPTGGYIKLHRKILNSWIADDCVAFTMFCLLMLWANRLDGRASLRKQLKVLKRGQIATSYGELAAKLGVDRKTIVRKLDAMKTDSMLDIKRDNSGTIITIMNYDDYQGDSEQVGTADGTAKGTAKGTADGTADGTHKETKRKDTRRLKEPVTAAREKGTVIVAKAIASLVSDLRAETKMSVGESLDRATKAVGADWRTFALAYPSWDGFARQYSKACKRGAEHLFEGDAVDKVTALIADDVCKPLSE